MGRRPKYDWTDKRDVCHKLYVEQKLPVSQVIEYFANHFKVPESELPASREFHRQFKKWDFPDRVRKLNPDEELTLKERVRELFKQNIPANEILERLNDEGWELDNYRFKALRRRLGLLYRSVEDGYRTNAQDKVKQKRSWKRKRLDGDVDGDGEGEADAEAVEDDNSQPNGQAPPQPQLPPLSPDEAARRAQRLVDLQIQSDQKLQTGKRRRRIRGLGPIGPDAPGMAPRYSSETSIDECKAFLRLTNDVYIQIRNQYESICREMGIIKMSLCAEGQWQASKDRLVRENMHLSSVLHPPQADIDKRLNALNVICMDVTKRMRDTEKSMTIADANNILGLNPIQSKDVRRLFYEILEDDRFTTVFESGKERYDMLQQRWHEKSDFLSQVMAENDPRKVKAVIVLTKDARKRYCDDQIKRDPNVRVWQSQKHYGPGPGPAPNTIRKKKPGDANIQSGNAPAFSPSSTRRGASALFPLGPSWEGIEMPRGRLTTMYDLAPDISFDLDPLLTRTTHGPPWPPPMSGSTDIAVVPAPASRRAPQTASVPAYFRLASNSQLVGHHPRMWLGKLAGASMDELRKAATSKAGAARVAKINGVVRNENGSEDSWLIESDDELEVYLGEAGEKATFVVLLEGGYA